MLEEIRSSLSAVDISVHDIQEFSSGLNSKVYLADSSKGNLTIHIVDCNIEHDYQQLDKKIILVYDELENHPDIPTAPIIAAGKLDDGGVFFVNLFLEGDQFGRREIKDMKVIDSYDVQDPEDLLKQLAKLMIRQHAIKGQGFGYIDTNKNHICGRYDTWLDYLSTESGRWLGNLAVPSEEPYISPEEYEQYKSDLRSLFEKQKGLLALTQASLLHWDINNPTNILIKDRNISGIIDYEWAILGDPLWDLVLSEDLVQEEYSRMTKTPLNLIRKKLLIYHPLWFLWGTNTHFPRPYILKTCLKEFTEGLDKLRDAGML